MIRQPKAVSAAAINSVSRARNGRRMRLGPVASAARINTRLVKDLDPGTWTVPTTAAFATGAGQ